MVYVYSVKYHFNQILDIPAKEAFDWCTDYQPNDLLLMKLKGNRRIRKVTNDTLILTETMPERNRKVTKTKLVRLNKAQLSWTNTHITGPYRHSQFLYQLVPDGRKRSRLYFTGLMVHYSKRRLSRGQLQKIARTVRDGDSTTWHHLATAIQKETASR